MKKIIFFILAAICFIGGVLGALYIGIWWGIIDPIMSIAEAIDADTLSAKFVAWEVCKFFLKEIFAAIVVFSSFSLGALFFNKA